MDSPDPLALSPTPMKRNMRKENSSPSKIVMSSGPGLGGSPWKIRVTVEAQRTDENGATPSRKIMSRTTTVPLKGGEDSSPVRRRGRSRKSDITSKRAGTPARKRRSIINIESSLTDGEAEVADPTFNPKTKKGRGRPRKSIVLQHTDEPTSIVVDAPEEDSIVVVHPEVAPATDQRPARSGSIAIPESGSSSSSKPADDENRSLINEVRGRHAAAFSSTRAKTQTSDGENIQHPMSTVEAIKFVLQKETDVPDKSVTLPVNMRQTGSRDPVTTSSLSELENGSTSGQLVDDVDEEHISPREADVGDETMLRSEDFSMVSIESLPSMRDQTHLPTPSASRPSSSNLPTPIRHNECSNMPRPRNSKGDISVTTPSSQELKSTVGRLLPMVMGMSMPYRSSRDVTPSYMPSSPPSMPPALHVPPTSRPKATTPRLQRVVRAGIALQGATRSPSTSTAAKEQGQRATLARFDDIFAGFGEGTRRELQAGLRLGEKLAEKSESEGRRRQNIRKSRMSRNHEKEGDRDPFSSKRTVVVDPNLATVSDIVHKVADYALAAPPAAPIPNEVRYPVLTTVMNSMQLHHTAEKIDAFNGLPKVAHHPKLAASLSVQDPEPMESINWHGSRILITNISKKQDPCAEEEYISDIWQEEASRSSQLDTDAGCTQMREEPSVLAEQTANEVLLRPKRSKLPRTWRRTSGSDFSYSDESDMSTNSLPAIQHSPGVELAKAPGKITAVSSPPSSASNDMALEGDTQYSGLLYTHEKPKGQITEKQNGPIDLSAILDIESSYTKSRSPIGLRPSPSELVEKSKPTMLDFDKETEATISNQKFLDSGPIMQQVTPSESSISRKGSYFEHSSPVKKIAVDFGSDFEKSLTNFSVANESTFDTSCDSVGRQLRSEMEAINIVNRAGEDRDSTSEMQSIITPPSSDGETDEYIPELTEESVSRIAPIRAYTPLFGASKPQSLKDNLEKTESSAAGLFRQFSSKIWSAFPSVSSTPSRPTHPLLTNFPLLPRIGPWSKTHYKVMDGLYQLYKKAPDAFSPKLRENNSILNESYRRFINIEVQNWGYYVRLPHELIILAALCHELCLLESQDDYKRIYGKPIEPNEGVVPDEEVGNVFKEKDMVLILFSVVAGEKLRKDERKGIRVGREGGLFFVRMSGHKEWLNIG